MAVEIPVVIDIEGAFADAAAKVSSASKPLKMSVEKLSEDLSKAIFNMNKYQVDSTKWKGAVKEIQRITELLDLANDKMKRYGSNTGSIRQMSAEMERLERQWSKLGEAQKYTKTGELSEQAKKLIADYDKVAKKVQETGKSLAAMYAEQQRAAQNTAVLTSAASSVEALNAKLRAWKQELNSSDLGSSRWTTAATEVAALSERIRQASEQLKKFMSESGSIDRLNAELQRLNRQWNAMSAADKYVNGVSGKLTPAAQQITKSYRAATEQLQKQGKSLSEITNQQIKLEQGIQNAADKRRYENLVLNSEANTMHRLAEQARILSERLDGAKIGSKRYEELRTKLDSVRQKMQELQGSAAGVNTEMKKQSAIWSSLVSYASMYFSVFGAIRFIKNVRETTAEFELQRVALAGIIQDTNKAESLFKEIKAAAIESPFQIKQLVTYTKQLSAYRIETDQLFDVTKRLADVSAGLGVDMNRLVLAYGQVKAASVLRGQELRQFTEAGIPLVDLLAKKFQELGREGTTTADVFELISKRAVPFSMISEIFEDMTEKGGIFYKMQEKQAKTLAGQWSNLKDALSIMYDEIGNTATVHGAMERLIADAKTLFNNWRIIGGVLKSVTYSFLAMKTATFFLPILTKNTNLAAKATTAKARADALEAANAKNANIVRTVAIAQLRTYTKHMQAAATASTMFGRTWHQLAANFLGGGWITMAITAVTVLAGWLVSARQEAQRLGKELAENIARGSLQAEQSVRNFERLAEAAVKAADGSAEQRDAIKELQRTYGDIIPSQDLEIKKLRELKGSYEALTDAIREKIEVQVHEENISQITDNFASNLGKQRKGLEDFLKEQEGYSVEEASRIIAGVEKAIKKGLLNVETDFMEAAKIIEEIAREQVGRNPILGFGQAFQQASGFFQFKSYYTKLVESSRKYNTEIQNEEERFQSLNNQLGIYADRMKAIRESVNNGPVGFALDKAGSFEFNQARWKQAIETYKKELVNAFGAIDISDALGTQDLIDFEKIFKKITSSNGNLALKNFVAEIQKDYNKLAPQEATTRLIVQGAQEIADGIGIAMSEVQGYLKEDGKSMEEYAKSVKEFVETQKNKVKELKWEQENFHQGVSNYIRPSDDDIAKEQKELDFLEKLLEFIKQFVKNTGGKGGYQQDPFIAQMQERMKFMQDFKKGYDDLNKYLSSNDALGRVADKMAARGLALGIDEAQQKMAAKELSEWYGEAMEEAFQAAKKYGASGSIREFLSMPIKDKSNRSKALKEFQNLIQSLFDAKTDLDISNLKKEFDDALKRLKDEIKHSETAKNFMNDIFDLTGNKQLATDLAVSVYGTPGDDLEDSIKKMLAKSFVIDSDAFPLMDPALIQQGIFKAIDEKDVVTLRKMLKYVVDDNKQAAEEIISNWEKEEADWLKNLYKTYEKAKTFQERKDLVRDRATATRNRINADRSLSDAEKNTALKAVDKQEARDIADIEIEALKTTYEWTAAFKDMERVSTATLKELVKLLDEYIEKNKETASPESLKTLTQAREQAHDQIVERNGYEGLVKSMSKYFAAQKKVNTLKKQGKKGTKEYRQALDEEREALKDAQKSMKAISDSFDTLGGIVSSVSDMLDLDELSDGRAVLEGIATGLSLVGTALIFINAMFTMLETNPIVLAISSIIAGVAALASIMSNLNVAKANREIEQQNKLLHQLEYNYDRLAAAIEKSFGSEYIYNYTKQLEILTAKQAAYNAQARAEESKGKKADQDKIQEYEDSARDAADQIEEMRHQLSEFFSGTDLTAAAEDFADAWIEAYKEFSSTTDAMSEKFNDMIQSMINKSLAAKIMQEMLQPIFDQIDELAKDGLLSTNDIAEIAALAQSRIPLINDAMTNLMTGLAAAGLDVRNATAGFHGISKEIASASEESILALAAGINTQNFYMSYMPTISENVSQILAAMTGTISPTAPVETTENGDVMPSVQKMVYDYLPTIDQRLMNIENLFKSVVTSKSGTSTNTNCVAVR